MYKDRRLVSAVLVVLTIAAGSAALAQSTAPNPSPPPSSSPTVSSTADQVKGWTLKKWNAMKHEWRKDKAKWDSCNRQAGDQKLTGKNSWAFIYDCMKTS
jgi:hypothetical protein